MASGREAGVSSHLDAEDLLRRLGLAIKQIAALEEKLAFTPQLIESYKSNYGAALEREKVYLAKLAALEWTEITPGNLPKVGDEVYGASIDFLGQPFHETAVVALDESGKSFDYWVGYSHKRSFTPPSRGSEDAERVTL